MSVELRQYLDNSGGNNFTENAPRPPVGPGEENELHSNGGHSNKSSSSQKSHHSNNSTGSANGGATPRRLKKPPKLLPATTNTLTSSVTANKVTKATQGCEEAEENEAPLGFEPEGSVDEKPDFTENGSPSYKRWHESLEHLLEDPDGVTLFKAYLTQENSGNLFDFYFAWKFLQNLDIDNDAKRISDLVRTMYKAFIKGDKKLPFITSDTKDRISKIIASKLDLKNTFNTIKEQVLQILSSEYYMPFFKSSIYLNHIQGIEGSPKESTQSIGSPGSQPLNMILPTVHEDSELDLKHLSSICDTSSEVPTTLALTVKNVRITERLRMDAKIKPEEQAGYYLRSRDEITQSLDHVSCMSYLPISAIDSERQSLSSEAMTDDTHSYTDSSVDGYPQFTNKKSIYRYYKRIKNSAQRNPETHVSSSQHFLPPKNQRMSKVSNLAETDPIEFSKVLCEKLQRVLDEQMRKEMVKTKLSAMSEDEATDDSHSVLSSGGVGTANTAVNQWFTALRAGDHEAEAHNCLDMHFKRIWEQSGQHTPAKSPRSKSPEHISQLASMTKRSHSMPRPSISNNIMVPTKSVMMLPYSSKPTTQLGNKPLSNPTLYSMDTSYPQGNVPNMSYAKSNSRQGLATFSSRAEQQSIFKLPATQSNNNQKVVEWISRNEEIMQHSSVNQLAESDRSSLRKSQRSTSTSASPRVMRNKAVNNKGSVPPESKRTVQDDKHSYKSKSTSSNNTKRTQLSRSAGDANVTQNMQSLTQKKGIREVPQIKVAFFLLDEPIPYSTTVPGADITLAKFKELIMKKGNYRYFFKKATDNEFGHEVPYVLEEITNDNAVLPTWESKVVGHVKKVE